VTAGDGAAGVAAFVPHVSVLTAMALTFFTVGVLVFFFHHVAESVRVTHVLGDLDRALQRMLEALPEGDDDEGDVEADAVPTDFRDDLGVIHARHGGYLQSVEVDALVAAAVERDALLRVLPIVGTFVTRGTPLAEVHPATATDAIADAVLGSVALATDRNPAQDLGFVFDEFLEIALRALSPSMNDPFTAQSCIDHLAQGLLLLDRRRLRRQVHLDADGRVRALVPLQGKGALARHTLGELRRASGGQLLVTRHLLTALLMLRREARGAALRAAVDDELRAVVAGAEGRVPPGDHARLRAMVAHLDPP